MIRHSTWLLAGLPCALVLWFADFGIADDLPRFRQQCLLKGHKGGRAFSVEFSADDKMIVSAGEDGTARIWNAATGRQQRILKGHKDYVLTAKFLPKGDRIITGSLDGTVRLWSTKSFRELKSHKSNPMPGTEEVGANELWRIAVSPDEKHILAEGICTLELWPVEGDWKESRSLFYEDHRFGHFGAFANDSRQMIVVAGQSNGRLLNTCSVPGFTLVKTTDLPVNDARSSGMGLQFLAYSPNGKKIAWVRKELDGLAAVFILDAKTSDVQMQWKSEEKSGGIYSLAWSPDSRRIAIAPRNGDCLVLDAETANITTRLSGPDRYSVAYSPDGRFIVTTGETYAELFDAATGTLIQKLPGEFKFTSKWAQESPYCRFSKDGKRIVVTSQPPIVWTCE